MNLKERGITVGDLLIIFLIILTSTILVKTFNNNKRTTLNHNIQEEIYNNKALLSKNHLKNLPI